MIFIVAVLFSEIMPSQLGLTYFLMKNASFDRLAFFNLYRIVIILQELELLAQLVVQQEQE